MLALTDEGNSALSHLAGNDIIWSKAVGSGPVEFAYKVDYDGPPFSPCITNIKATKLARTLNMLVTQQLHKS